MPFLFAHVCDLLEDLERLHIRPHPLLPKELHQRTTQRANQWLKNHKFNLNAFSTQEDAILWILRPDRLVDRVYGLDANRLEHIIARTYELLHVDYQRLQIWKYAPHKGDLGACAEFVRSRMKFPSLLKHELVSVEEIQALLLRIASFNSASSSAVQSLQAHFQPVDVVRSLGDLYRRMPGREAKWLTRYILKDYRAIFLPDSWEIESGYLGMPNVASITMNIFSKSPPLPILLNGTRLVKGVASVKKIHERCSPRAGLRKSEHGWPKRTLVRSREASPMSPPLTFAKGILIAEKSSDPPSVWTHTATRVTLQDGVSQTERLLLSTSVEDLSDKVAVDVPTPGCPISTKEGPSTQSVATDARSAGVVTRQSSIGLHQTGQSSHLIIDLTQSSPVSSFQTSTDHSSRIPVSTATTTPSRSALSVLTTNTLRRQAPPKGDKLSISKFQLQAGQGICSRNGSTCPLTRCVFLISPTLSKNSRLARHLLPQHSSLHFTDMSYLAHSSFPECCPKTRLRYRKITLVDTYERHETVAFLKAVQSLNLQRKVQDRRRKKRSESILVKEWLEVYDWRLLEMIGKMEAGKVYDYNIWQRCFVCTI